MKYRRQVGMGKVQYFIVALPIADRYYSDVEKKKRNEMGRSSVNQTLIQSKVTYLFFNSVSGLNRM